VLLLVAVLVLALAVRPSAAGADEPPSVHEVAGALMCQCGCGMTVATCQESMPCATSDGMILEIQRQIGEGKSKPEILDSFASIYGEGVLALPRKSGFSLAAWVVPFLGLSAGGVLISGLVWFWTRRGIAHRTAALPATPSEELKSYEERVDQDLGLLD
jgi:cytochrome c-type biogenesis protein CcmH